MADKGNSIILKISAKDLFALYLVGSFSTLFPLLVLVAILSQFNAGFIPLGKRWFIAKKRGRLRAMAESIEKEIYKEWERRNAQIRAKVEHLFHYRIVRYRGLAKNRAQIYSLFALANLVIAKRARRPA